MKTAVTVPEQHAQTFIFRQGDSPPCELCGKTIEKNRVWIIPDLEAPAPGFPAYMGEPKVFHLTCARDMLTILVKNRERKE